MGGLNEKKSKKIKHSPTNNSGGFPIKKLIYGIALAVGLFGILLTLILGFVVFGILDNVEKVSSIQIDSVILTLGDLEKSMSSVVNEVNNTNNTIVYAKDSISPFSSSLSKLSDSLGSISDSFSVVGITVPFDEVVSDLDDASLNLNELENSFDNHSSTLGDLKNNLNNVKSDISKAKNELSKSKKTIIKIFSDIKLAVVIYIFAQLSLFFVLVLVSIGQFV